MNSQDIQTALIPCPFCGKAGVIVDDDMATCGDDSCAGFTIYTTPEKWNARAEVPELQQQVKVLPPNEVPCLPTERIVALARATRIEIETEHEVAFDPDVRSIVESRIGIVLVRAMQELAYQSAPTSQQHEPAIRSDDLKLAGDYGHDDLNDLSNEELFSVAEIPDRTSPDDQPEMMLVTADEPSTIVKDHLERLLPQQRGYDAEFRRLASAYGRAVAQHACTVGAAAEPLHAKSLEAFSALCAYVEGLPHERGVNG